MTGWIKLSRLFLEHALWTERRRFSRAEAALDILLRVNHAPARILVGLRFLQILPGQLLTSQVDLSKRWGWNRKTVASFLGTLKKAEIVDFRTVKGADKGYTLVTFFNYERFPLTDNADLDIAPDIGLAMKRTSEGHQAGINENEKTDKNLSLRGGKGEQASSPSVRRGVSPQDVLRIFPGARVCGPEQKKPGGEQLRISVG